MATVPILQCPQSVKIPKSELTDDQLNLLAQFKKLEPWSSVPEPEPHSFEELEQQAHSGTFFDDEYWQKHFEEYCSDATLVRYLRAFEWDLETAESNLKKTLAWRRKFAPHLIRPSDIEDEAKTGKQYINGFSVSGSPVIYYRPHRNKSNDYARQVRYLVYTLERAISLMPEGQDQVTLVFDFNHYSSSTSPPMHVSKYFLHLFSSYYPERLGLALACDAPWYFWVFYKLIQPFIHPVTKSKIKFVETQPKKEQASGGVFVKIQDVIHPNILEKDFGGNFEFSYHHETYWTLVTERVEE